MERAIKVPELREREEYSNTESLPLRVDPQLKADIDSIGARYGRKQKAEWIRKVLRQAVSEAKKTFR